MINNLSPDLPFAGSSLLLGENSLLRDLSEEDEALIAGGARSNSRSGRRKRRRKRRRGKSQPQPQPHLK